MNGFKTIILMVAMTYLFMFIGNQVGGQQGMMTALIMATAMNFFSYWFSDKMVLSMYKAKLVDPNSALYQLVQRVAQRAEVPMPKVYVIEERQPNAFATGRNPKHAAVAVTRGIMELLDEDELSGVIGHELGHVHNRDILIGTVAATMAGAIMMLSRMAQFGAMFGGGGRDENGRSSGGGISMLLTAMLAPFAAMLIQMAISRTREYKADAFGAKVSGNPLFLSRALKKLELGARMNPLNANMATENMFIINPFTGRQMASLFSTHPATAERVARLEQMSQTGVIPNE